MRNPQTLVEELFEAAEHDVASEVGTVPGTIVRTARAHAGLVRPKIAWVIWEAWPASIEDAFEELERLRTDVGADRAIGLFDGKAPEGQAGAVKRGALDVMTIRRFAFELARIEQHLAEIHAQFEAELGADFLPRTMETEDGRRVDAVTSIVEWSQTAGDNELLCIAGEHFGGRRTVIRAAASRIADRFASKADSSRPILTWEMAQTAFGKVLGREGWALFDGSEGGETEPSFICHRWNMDGDLGLPKLPVGTTVLHLVQPTVPESLSWIAARANRGAKALSRLASSVPDLGALLRFPAGLRRWADVVENRWPTDEGTSDAEVAARLIVALLDDMPALTEDDPLLRWAFEELVLGTCSVQNDFRGEHDVVPARDHIFEALGWPLIRDHRFTNTLLRDYLVARLLILKLQAGHRDLLTRHQFPREYVLLFLAILSPETAALVSEDRSKTMQAEIAAEVEREVQLALAHNLKHPVALIHGALKDARRKLPPAERDSVAAELSQIDDAARHIVALVDKMKQWSNVPTEPLEPTSLASALSRALTPLRREAPHVLCSVQVLEGIRVQATPEILQVILSNLLENAFQAVEQSSPERRVTVRAQRTGETFRVDVIDTGPGVHAADRDRIFEPHVTTKKGGAGRPRGTGMGLSIARKYAHHIGGRLWLDADARETTFVLELVPARDTSNDP